MDLNPAVIILSIILGVYLLWKLTVAIGGRGSVFSVIDVFLTIYAASYLTINFMVWAEIEPSQGILVLSGVVFVIIYILARIKTVRKALKNFFIGSDS